MTAITAEELRSILAGIPLEDKDAYAEMVTDDVVEAIAGPQGANVTQSYVQGIADVLIEQGVGAHVWGMEWFHRYAIVFRRECSPLLDFIGANVDEPVAVVPLNIYDQSNGVLSRYANVHVGDDRIGVLSFRTDCIQDRMLSWKYEGVIPGYINPVTGDSQVTLRQTGSRRSDAHTVPFG